MNERNPAKPGKEKFTQEAAHSKGGGGGGATLLENCGRRRISKRESEVAPSKIFFVSAWLRWKEF